MVVGLIAVIAVSLLIVYKNSILNSEGSGVAWQRNIQNFATSLAVDDGNVFTMDISGNVNCYDSQTGVPVWNGSVDGYFDSGLTVSNGRVYGGSELASVSCLDEETGQFQWNFMGWLGNSLYSKRAPDDIVVQNDIVYSIIEDGPGREVTAHNASSGELLWQGEAFEETTSFGNITDLNTWQASGRVLGGDPFEGNSVYALGGNLSSPDIFKLITDNGTIFWQSKSAINISNGIPSVVGNYQGQVILESGTQILSLNQTSGESLWSKDIGATVYSPTICQGVLLFGASDGNFYGLSLISGKVSCMTKVDTQSVLNQTSSDLTTYPIQVDPENQRIYWSFGVIQQGQFKATIVSLDLATCEVVWRRQIQDNVTSTQSQAGLTVNKESVFLTENNTLWVFGVSSGDTVKNQHFDHYRSCTSRVR